MPAFWSIEIELPFAALTPFEELLGEDAGVAVSSYEVRGGAAWRLQVLFDAPPDEKAWRRRLTAIARGLDLARAPISAARLPDQDWVRHTNRLNAPIQAGRFLLYGRHDMAHLPPAALKLCVDAGLAFGTGRAPSTFGCLLAIDSLCRRHLPRRALDLGTGSGVLAMAAARARVRHVIAADIDPVAVAVARSNVALNGLAARVRCLAASRPGDPRLRGCYDLAVANILAEPLCRMARDLSRRVAPGGHLVLSGILAREERLVLAHYRSQGLHLVRRIAREGWHTLVLARRHGKD